MKIFADVEYKTDEISQLILRLLPFPSFDDHWAINNNSTWHNYPEESL